MLTYQIAPSRYVRGVAIVETQDERARELCDTLSRGKYSDRERGWRMDGHTLRKFMRAARHSGERRP